LIFVYRNSLIYLKYLKYDRIMVDGCLSKAKKQGIHVKRT
jgi:hypothetical protein